MSNKIQPLLVSDSTRLGWIKQYEILFDPEAPSLVLSLTPKFPFCASDLDKKGIVWGLEKLINSIRKPGAYRILNSECGYPPDAGIEADVLVNHPDANTVVWQLDITGLRPAIDLNIEGDGFIQLIFEREHYETDIRRMLNDVQTDATTPLPIKLLRDHRNYEDLLTEYPSLTHCPVKQFEPGFNNGEFIEDVLIVDCDALVTET